MNKILKELLSAARWAVEWMKGATLPNEANPTLERLEAAIRKAEQSEKAEIRTGYLLLVELADGRRRITATVATPDEYMARTGWSQLDVQAEVAYSEEVKDLTWARDDLKVLLPDARWTAAGMQWSDFPREDLIAAMCTIAESVNR